jgi:GT2 family glycosyltransferase
MADVLSIYLLTHNRPHQAIEAIRSILAQSDRRFKLIVSDNSDNNELSALLGSLMPSLEYIYRNDDGACLPAFEHFNLCISEVKTQYFSLLHDDDLVMPNYVGQFWRAQQLFPNAIAFGCNAKIRHLSGLEQPSFVSSRQYCGPIAAQNLAWRYFGKHQLGIAPFPFYVYNKHAIGNMHFSGQFGKYGDVAWLLDLANKGDMVWINSAMGVYQHHQGNDSNLESRRDRLRFLAYLKQNKLPEHSLLLTLYRRFLYKKILSSNEILIGSKRSEVLGRFMTAPLYRMRIFLFNLNPLFFKCKVKIELFIMKALGRSHAIR